MIQRATLAFEDAPQPMLICAAIVPSADSRSLSKALEVLVAQRLDQLGEQPVLGIGLIAGSERPYDALVVVTQQRWSTPGLTLEDRAGALRRPRDRRPLCSAWPPGPARACGNPWQATRRAAVGAVRGAATTPRARREAVCTAGASQWCSSAPTATGELGASPAVRQRSWRAGRSPAGSEPATCPTRPWCAARNSCCFPWDVALAVAVDVEFSVYDSGPLMRFWGMPFPVPFRSSTRTAPLVCGPGALSGLPLADSPGRLPSRDHSRLVLHARTMPPST
jgi:hypothetical protein